MKRIVISRLFQAVAMVCMVFMPAALQSSAPPGPDAPGAVRLFNGINLDGFYVLLRNHETNELRPVNEDPLGVVTVVDGMIRNSGQEFGHFITKESYKNYRLVVEWRWGGKTWPPREDKARDSGILVHAVPPDKVWNKSIEYQIIEGGTGDIIVVDGARISRGDTTRTSGRFDRYNKGPWQDVLDFRHERYEYDHPVGEWNTSEVVCDGDRMTCILNGVVVNDGYGAAPGAGQIIFQTEGAEIFFRRIELVPLR